MTDDEILARIRRNHPAWTVSKAEGDLWRALLPQAAGEHVIFRRHLADLETRIAEVDRVIQARAARAASETMPS
jgi:hypothetical protein